MLTDRHRIHDDQCRLVGIKAGEPRVIAATIAERHHASTTYPPCLTADNNRPSRKSAVPLWPLTFTPGPLDPVARPRVVRPARHGPESGRAAADGRGMVRSDRHKLVPQAAAPPALVVAIVGGTNIGKSAIFNHLAGEMATPSAPWPPACRHPVCLVPQDFDDATVLGWAIYRIHSVPLARGRGSAG